MRQEQGYSVGPGFVRGWRPNIVFHIPKSERTRPVVVDKLYR